ncbi:uroporphyrinogen-III C-methyltransferase [bacterium]|nr:uroporphyrinogen-III C-methyltransferase [bacterium]
MNGAFVSLVGSGPGDPGLITVKGMECIRAADVVVYDFLANPRLLDAARPDAEVIYVGKRGGQHTMKQEEINALLVAKAAEGKRVCRLKGGDPYVFGRGGEEALELVAAGIPFEVVPGVTAGVAAPAYAGIPVTHRDCTSSLAFVTGHEDPAKAVSALDWGALARGVGTLVVYMGVKRLPQTIAALRRGGLPADTPAALIQWGTLPRQQTATGTLDTILDTGKHIQPPAIFVVGSVVKLREQLQWFEKRPLSGRTVVVTRSRTQSSQLSCRLDALGAEVVEMPTIRIDPPESYRPLDDAIARLDTYSWVVFTSVNGVDAFFTRLAVVGRDARALPLVASIGRATTERLAALGIRADCQPTRFIGEALVDTLAAQADVRGRRILLPHAPEAPDTVPEGLRAHGATVDVVAAYRTVIAADADSPIVERLLEGEVDVVTFTSSSTVRGFVNALGATRVKELPASTCFVSIGPVTSATARELGLPLAAEAAEHTIPGVVDAIVKLASGDRTRAS